MPLVGSSRMMTCGCVASHLAITTFCWLPPDKISNILIKRRGPQVKPLGIFAGQLEFFRQPKKP